MFECGDPGARSHSHILGRHAAGAQSHPRSTAAPQKRVLILYPSLIFAALLASVSFAAESTPATKLEIAHLFSHLQLSGCQFYRNGTWYDSSEAVNHLNKKYQYLLDKGLVASSEDFIERAASASSMSGLAYRVRCGSNPAVNIDGRPWFAKPSICDVQQVEIAAIDPDFDRGRGLCP